jgi:hypothetical protein
LLNEPLEIEGKRILIEIMDKADNKLKQLMDQNIERFITVFNTHFKEKGIKWDDLVIKFEWTFESDEILKFVHSSSLFD